ncbi:hypothetical protein Pla52o_25650 [Novipirellula galeiformis]|uniref:Uncharacterized protein n=1 Tax=Novipirellula galeiformis TaxID=2528004 RepID=A0A5C6CI68_9BACT|nr:hypothetical protein Pla52o_25650 [Novipirellula galeiformis]
MVNAAVWGPTQSSPRGEGARPLDHAAKRRLAAELRRLVNAAKKAILRDLPQLAAVEIDRR